MQYTVYLRRNLINGMQYVGQTSNFKERQWDWNCLKHRYANKHIDKDRLKYGFDAWTVEVLAEADNIEDAWELEQRFIKDYNTLWPNGYNLAKGGAGSNGLKLSDETKQKISEALKGENHPKYWLGKQRSDETKQKISEALKGENHPMFGTHRSEETKQKISESKKIPVYQYTKNGELVGIWKSATDAAEKSGIQRSHITACCNGKRKTAGGYIWSYKQLTPTVS